MEDPDETRAAPPTTHTQPPRRRQQVVSATTTNLAVDGLWERALQTRLGMSASTSEPPVRHGGFIPANHRWASAHATHKLAVTNTVIFLQAMRVLGCLETTETPSTMSFG